MKFILFDVGLVLLIFILYVTLWYIKSVTMNKTIGLNPKVFKKSTSKVQLYFSYIEYILTISILIILFMHTFLYDKTLFTKLLFDNKIIQNIIGFIISITGLIICRIAQNTMGKSWRVGIDETTKTDLITDGIYKLIRNPTFTGLFILCLGVFIILPTVLLSYWIIIFVITIEFHVRCEEDYLEKTYKDTYKNYYKTTKRYIPYIY